MEIKKIVLAYSGGLDTSVILKWLVETYGCEVIAFCADVGQEEDWEEIKEKGLACGASKVIIQDLKYEFVKDYVFFAIKAGARYEDWYLLGTSLARPLIAKAQVEVALKEGADALAHGATGKGNDQVRFELAYSALAPHLKVIAPWREWDFKGRSDLIAYAKEKNINIPVTPEKPYSIDANLFHMSYEGGILEDLWQEPPEDMFILTNSQEKAPDSPQYIEITFDKGEPVALDGEALDCVTLLKRLNYLGGLHGIGRIDMVENRYVGIKSRSVYETPGGTILHIAHRALEQITLDREVMRLKDKLMPYIAELIYYGYWFSPEFQILKKTIEDTQERVVGTIRLKLYKGQVQVCGRKSPFSLYNKSLASFEEKEGYNPKDAEGFIRLQGLRLKNYQI
ncbi:MAG: argininosuccinate synthase [Thermodesulfobacteriaceae bacterium]|nr:argininosuccinate synthase [Thermodesulfobacteriaceae bacterium]